ncbi:hypothetical protein J5N97_023940 [Dioscorea zingiberensis]|uniref:Uncharacterized protein n=1 Tax=Dioscorea zingiberensis TaxID=325984 RepID=A0A9D5H8E1_9LILI|nr:hypothetical protein J5N97_023940 [Dioscorea zingiberensis]
MLAKLIHSSSSSSSSSGRVATRLKVEEEYKQTLRTRSYIEIWNKAHHKLMKRTTTSNELEQEEEDMVLVLENPNCINSSSPFSLPDLLIEPKQEVVIHLKDHEGGFSASLGDYFDATFQAFTACSSLLNSIERTRYHHKTILQLLNKNKNNNNRFSELTSMLDLPNPIDPQTLSYLNEMRKDLGSLTERLTEARRRMKRRMRVVNAWKRVSVVLLVAACSAAAAAALVVAGHVVVVFGVVAVVPVVVGEWRGRRRRRVEKVVEGVDAAARGAYIVGREMETMGMMVRRVGDEVEHRREVARMAARSGERRMVREAVKEMESGEEGFRRQMKELEEHVYLSLLAINKTRRQVVKEMHACYHGCPLTVI